MYARKGEAGGELDRVIERAMQQAAAVIDRVFQSLALPKPSQEELRAKFEAIMQSQSEQEFMMGQAGYLQDFGQEEWDRQGSLMYLRSRTSGSFGQEEEEEGGASL